MNNRKISWEIVIAGLAFIGIAIYLLDRNTPNHNPDPHPFPHRQHAPAPPEPPEPPEPPHLPSTIVIDLNNMEKLRNLENLKNLRNLDNLKNLERLEIKLKNLDSIVDGKQVQQSERQAVEQAMKQLEQELQQLEKADFKVKLQNNKVYINKDYKVRESAWSEVSPGVFVFREPFNATNLKSMDLRVGFGSLNIIGSDNGQAELVVRATGDVSSAEELKNALTISRSVHTDEASFSILPRSRRGSADAIHLETTLTLPRDIAVDASTSGGHISVNSLNGSHNFVTAGGHITLDDVKGTTTAKTSGGHITGDNVSGDVTLSTSGGHIQVSDGTGTINAQTGGGNIELSDLRGNIEAKTSGGNIVAELQQIEAPLTLSTSAGNIVLSVPSSTSANLTARGTSINLVDAFNFEGSRTNGNISGTLNGGGPPVTLSCGYGNVTIKDER